MKTLSYIAVLSAALVALAACGDRSSTTQQANNPTPSPPPQAAAPPPPPPPPPPDPNEELAKALDNLGAQSSDQGRVVRLSSAQFKPGETQFEPSDSQRIDSIVTILRDHPETHLIIEGFTDSRGSEAANKKIATERADAVRQMLVDRGIDASRLQTKGLGEAQPIADNGTAAGREQNRRVELIFSDAQGRFASAAAPTPSG